MINRRAFVSGLLGTVAGGLILAGLLALVHWASHVDFFTILIFVVIPATGLMAALAIHFTGRGASNWASSVEKRLQALEAKVELDGETSNETSNERV